MLLEDFYLMFPEFDNDSARKYFPLVEGLYPSYYGADYDTAEKKDKTIILYLCAHLLSVRINQVTGSEDSESVAGITPRVASLSADGVSESYITTNYDTDGYLAFFSATPYGLQFISLTRFNAGGKWI